MESAFSNPHKSLPLVQVSPRRTLEGENYSYDTQVTTNVELQEARQGTIDIHGEADIVKALLKFIYYGDYTYNPRIVGSSDDADWVHNINVHSAVYLAAKMYGVPTLAQLAEGRILADAAAFRIHKDKLQSAVRKDRQSSTKRKRVRSPELPLDLEGIWEEDL